MDKGAIPRKAAGNEPAGEVAEELAKSLGVNLSGYSEAIWAIAGQVVAQGGSDVSKASIRVCNRIEDLLGEMNISEPDYFSSRRFEGKTTLAEFRERRARNVSALLGAITKDKETLREFVRDPERFVCQKKEEKKDETKLAKIGGL